MSARLSALIRSLLILAILANLIPPPPVVRAAISHDAPNTSRQDAQYPISNPHYPISPTWLPIFIPPNGELAGNTVARQPSKEGQPRLSFDLSVPQTITLTVGTSSDDARYDEYLGYSHTSSSLSIGTSGGSNVYTQTAGWRFTNVLIPQGATIQSARMHLVKSGDAWISWEFNWYGEEVGDAATFSSASTPEDRPRTTASVYHSDNVRHLDGVRYELDEINGVVQEIVDRADWSSGNDLVILARADWAGWSRKFWRTYDYTTTDAAQLVLTYVFSDAQELSADFEGAPISGTAPLTVTFTNLSTGATAYEWSFGDGSQPTNQPANQPTITHTYAQTGSYTVILTATAGSESDVETKTDYISVTAESPLTVTADFTGTPVSGIVPLTVTFTNLSSGATAYEWSFGDGVTSTLTNPAHTYAQTGTYTVSLTASDGVTSDTLARPNYVTVSEPPSGPQTITLTVGTSSDDARYDEYLGYSHTSSSLSTGTSGGSNVYTQTAGWRFTNVPIPQGATIQSARMHLVKSGNEWKACEFNWYGEEVGDAATFSSASTPEDRPRTTASVYHSDNAQHLDGVRYELDEINGVVQEIVDRADWSSGNDLVILARADWEGWAKKFWRTYDYTTTDAAQLVLTYVFSDAQELSADFEGAPISGTAPLTVTFTNLSTGATAYEWSFGDGSQPTNQPANQPTITHTYTQTGSYTVILTATAGSESDVATKTDYISVAAETPVTVTADFAGIPVSGTAPLTVTFTNLSTSSGEVDGYAWSFGDGPSGTSTLTNPVHVYTQTGSYTVILTATAGAESDVEVKSDYISVTAESPPTVTADFGATPTGGTAPLTVTFSNLSSGATDYEWSFGDSVTSTLTNPVHVYTQTGSYSVVLTATAGAESDVEVKSDYISVTAETPVTVTADFAGEPVSGTAPLLVAFTNLSTSSGEIDGYEWSFGDEESSAVAHPSHVYTQPGLYTVTLTATAGSEHDVEAKHDYILVTEVVPVIVQAPLITLTAPAEGALLEVGEVQVTGVVSDDGTVVGVWVNEVTATLVNDAFNATISLSSGNQIINAVAEDDAGAFGFANRVVHVDGEGPQINIHTPQDRGAVYTLTPTVAISYTDFYTTVNTTTFSAALTDDEGTATDVSNNFTVGQGGASGDLGGPLDEDAVYTLTVSIADALGNSGNDRSTFYVPPDPASFTPPGVSGGTGWVSGVVYDSSTCDAYLTACGGLAGVRVTVAPINHETRVLTTPLTGTAVTGPDGFFAFPVDATGTYALRLEKSGYTYGQRELAVVRGHASAADALYLTPLDTAVSVISYPLTQTVVHTNTDETLVVEIPPGAIAPGETVTVTATNFEHVEFLPSGSLPPGTWETYAFNLGGDSEARFTRPITVKQQNYRDFAPGTQIPLGYWNQETLGWEHTGVGTVDESGEWVVMHVLHFSNYDCNDPIPILPPGEYRPWIEIPIFGPCSKGESGCLIGVKSGQVREAVGLPAVNVLGQGMAPELSYSTKRANPSQVIDTHFNLSPSSELIELDDYVQFELYVEGQKTDRFSFEVDPSGEGGTGRYRYLWDGRNVLGEQMPPGVYETAVRLSVPYTTTYCYALDGIFGNPPDCERGYVGQGYVSKDYWVYGSVELNPQSDSPFGSGWGLEGLQQIFEDEAGHILVVDGDRLDEYYFKPADQLDGLSQYNLSQPRVTGPAAALPIPDWPANGTHVSGTLSADATWTAANSPYVVSGGDVVVPAGVTLTVEPGVSVMLDQYRSLVVSGTLSAVGTAVSPITFTAYYSGEYRYWQRYPVYDSEGDTYWFVDAIGAAPNGDVWFVKTRSGEGFEAIAVRLRANSTLSDTFEMPLEEGTWGVSSLAVDGAGQKWFATDAGALMLDADDDTWTSYQAQPDGLVSDEVHDVAVDGENNVWFATGSGVSVRLSSEDWISYTTENSGLVYEWSVNAIAFDGNGDVWIGTDAGLNKLQDPGGTETWTLYDTSNDGILSDSVNDVAIDNGGGVWMAHGGAGVSVLLTSEEWITYTTENSGLTSSYVTAIGVDTEDRKWIGYGDDGVSLLSADGATWTHVAPPTPGAEGGDHTSSPLGFESMDGVAVAVDGAVWLANDEGGAVRSYYGSYQDGVISGGHWGSLRLAAESSGGGEGEGEGDAPLSRLSHVTLEMGGVSDQSNLYLYRSAPQLAHLTIRGSGGDGLYAYESDGFTLQEATLQSNEGAGVHIAGGAGGHELLTVTVQHNNGHGLYLDHSGTISVVSATLAYNAGYGVFTADGDNALTLSDSVVHDNAVAGRLAINALWQNTPWHDNLRQELEWLGGTLNGDRTWLSDTVEAYVVLGDVTIGDNAALTVTAGTTLRFDASALTAHGRLSVVGTAEAPITFGPAGKETTWYGVQIGGGEGNSDASHLSYVIIGGATTGLSLQSSAPALDHLSLIENETGLAVNYSSGVVVTASNFVNNQLYGINNNQPGQVVSATGNFWGAPSGPYHAGLNPDGDGDRVSNGVDFEPWLSKPSYVAGVHYVLDNRTATDPSTLAYDADSGTYTRTYPDGRQVHFDAQGRHDTTLEPDGSQTVYTYNPDGSVATLGVVAPGEDAPRWIWTFDYQSPIPNPQSLITITDPAGRVVTFTVDGNNQLSQVSFPDGSSRGFLYDSRSLLTQQVDQEGGVTSYVYDDYGRLVEHIGPQREIYDSASGETTPGQEVKAFTPSEIAYPLINEGPLGNPHNPAPPVVTSTLLLDEVSYGRGGRSGHTNEWGNWLDETDALGRTTTYTRDAASNVTNVTWPEGDCLDATYDDEGKPLSVARMGAEQCALPAGERDADQIQEAALTYEPRFNQLKTTTDALGRTTTYYYDYELDLGETGKLIRAEYPPLRDENGVLVTPVVSYTYNSWGLLETETDRLGTVTRYIYTQGSNDEAYGQPGALFAPGVTPVPGLLTQIVRDDGGLALTTTYKDFDVLGNPLTEVGPGGALTTTYTYDAYGRVLSVTDAQGIVTLYAYDERGQVVRSVADYTADGMTGENVVTTYTYDTDGRLLQTSHQAEDEIRTTQYAYDVNGQLVSERDGLGRETRYVYDDAGQLVNVIDPAGYTITRTYTLDGRREREIDAEGTATRYVYDDLGRLAREIRDEGGPSGGSGQGLALTTVYTYGLNNTLQAVAAPDGVVTCYEYDDLNRRTAEIRDCGSSISSGQALSLTTRYAYDLNGNTVYVTDTRGSVTYYEYDALGRAILSRQDHGGLDLETRYVYDASGNLSVVTDTHGSVTTFSYDGMNRLVQRCADAPGLNLCTGYGYDRLGQQAVVTDANGVVQYTAYNDLGLPAQIIEDYGGLNATTVLTYDAALNLIHVTDANGSRTHYTYTPRNAVASEVYADGTQVSHAYDPRGNETVLTLQDGQTITNTYDTLGRRVSAAFSTSGSQTFTYDALGRMTGAQQTLDDHDTALTYAYNALGDVVSTTQQLDGGTAWQVDYGYNYVGGVFTVTYPSGAQRVQTMDALNRLDAVRQGDGSLVADYAYHDQERYTTLAYPNGLYTRSDYDTLGRTTRVSSTVADYRYGYDAVGNRTYMQRYHQPGQPADVYQYDALYQLNQVWYGADATDPGSITSYAHLQQYDLDLLGNRLEVQNDGAGEVYQPNDGEQSTDPLNRYETVGSNALRYNLRGNTLGDGVYTYTYDALNRQTGASGPGGTAEYVYDARGRRVAKVTDGVTVTHYVYDTRYRVIEERDASEALLARYTYGSGMDEPLTMERGGETYYYHRDALGSITEVTDDAGDLVERYEYDVYGAVTIFDGAGVTLTASAIGNPYLFTARRYDPESGNYYYRARMYSPRLGRFLSMDPIGFDAGDYNLYRYVFNNPVNFTDPSGEFVDTLLDAVFITSDVILIGHDLYKLFTSDECKFKLLQDLGVDVFALGVDVIFAVLPGATGGGPAARATITTQGSGAAVAAMLVGAADEELLNLLQRGLQGMLKAHQVGRHFWLSQTSDSGGDSGSSNRLSDDEYEEAVRRATGGKSEYVDGREIDSVTNNALIQAKNNPSAVNKPDNFLSGNRKRQIKNTIQSAGTRGLRAEFWFPQEPHSKVRQYIENKGGIVVVYSP